jgi:Tfp pilus assembly pilus retraction ATPase PilT
MVSARKDGMITMDTTLKDMLNRGVISGRNAYNAALEKRAFEETKEQD